MAGFFSPDNWYWKPFSYVGDAVLLSGVWLITSLPIFTAGAATTALYDCVAHRKKLAMAGFSSRLKV